MKSKPAGSVWVGQRWKGGGSVWSSCEGWECRSGAVTPPAVAWPLGDGIFVCSVLLLRLAVSQNKNFKFSQILPVLFLAVDLFLLTNE